LLITIHLPSIFSRWKKAVKQKPETSFASMRALASAREALRGFITAIVIPPGDGLLEVRGDLGRMLAAAAGERAGEALAAVAYDGCGGSQPAISAAVALDRMRCGQAQLGFVSIIESAILVGQASWVTRSAADAARFEHGFEPRTRNDRLYFERAIAA